MATLQKIRTQGGLLVAIVIGLALFAFIIGDMFQSGSSVFNKGRLEIGVIDGEAVQYPDFQKKVEELADIYKSNTGQTQLDDNTWSQVRDQTWETMVRERIMGKVYESLGLAVTSDELFDMLQGNNIHPIVQQIFTNPNTGGFDRSAVVNFLKNLETGVTPEQRNYWMYLENQIVTERLQAKYNTLISKALNATSDEAQQSLQAKNREVDFEFIAMNHNIIADTAVKVTDKELRDYFSRNKDEYKQEKSWQIEYVAFSVTPSAEDFSTTEKWITDIRDDFVAATDNIQFVNSNSDDRFDGTWMKVDALPVNISSWIAGSDLVVGEVFGPYFDDNKYILSKVHAIEMLPDSVQARHILLAVENPALSATVQARADSLKGVIEKGGDFASLARLYSTDTGSAMNGGDLGWFGRGMMVKPFEEAAFKNKGNEVTVVTSQFGIHIVQTTKRGPLTKQYQLANLVRSVIASTKTYQAVYAKASRFASENTNKEKFDAAIVKDNLEKKSATFGENERNIAGLEFARTLIRAAFEGKTGTILKNTDGSPIFELGDNFVIATLVGATEEGPAPFENVKERVNLAVIKDKKAQLLADRMTKAAQGKSDMYVIASELGGEVSIASAINFNSISIPGAGMEPAVIGTVAALEPTIISPPVKGNNAVFLCRVTSVNEGSDTNVEAEKLRLTQGLGFRVSYQAFSALEKATEVVDKRAKFY